ncbi:MAG: glycosyltransferase family 39 protein [Candidatus Aenigmarchaeota archaeon]|nr:glycosyltransferase family 39 protein [Candidatus Aenigmarchaeota archaeon]
MRLGEVTERARGMLTLKFFVRYWWLWCLILIVVFTFWARNIPAKYGELQALDPFYAYRMNLYMLENNLQLPQHDYMRYWPDGVSIEKYGPLLYFYVPVVIYLAFLFVGISMPYLDFALLYPALMGAISVFIIYWIAVEVFKDKKAGIFAAVFLATIPAYISRTSAGFFDKEATGGTLMLLGIYMFVRACNKDSWKIGLLSMIPVAIAIGSWGGAQFIMFIISGFIILKLVLNQYNDAMIKAAIPCLLAAVLSQRYIIGYYTWPFEQVISIVAIGLIALRYAAGRYKLVRKDQLPYLIPATLALIILTVLFGSMFSDFFWRLINRVLVLTQSGGEKGYIGSTVAEQMTGSWNDITSRANVAFASSILPVSAPFDTLFSIWFLMILGSLVIFYNLYSRREWMLMLPLLWLLMSIQTVFFMVRLVFFLAPPAALVAAYFLSEALNRFKSLNYMKSRSGLRKLNFASIPLIAFVSMLILANLAAGYIFCNSIGPSFNSYWGEAMDYLAEETPLNASVLSWWDFGYWFQMRGQRPSTADGGNLNGSVNEQIADWYVADSQNWTSYRSWLTGKDVSYILMDYTLPGKYGAISKIASRGKTVIGMLQFQQSGVYPQENKTIVEYKAGQYTIWLPVSESGNIAGAPIFMISQGDQYLGRTYVTDLCTTSGIIKLPAPENGDTMPGCITITAYGLFYIPTEAEYSTFTNLMFMDGYGIPDVKKVFDNNLIKIYKLEINETADALS